MSPLRHPKRDDGLTERDRERLRAMDALGTDDERLAAYQGAAKGTERAKHGPDKDRMKRPEKDRAKRGRRT